MFLEFIPSETKKYIIIEYFLASSGNEKGLYFLVRNQEGTEIKKIFLDIDDVSNEFLPQKTKDEEVKYKAAGIESGEENILIVETGVWKKKTVVNQIKEFAAKKYRFILKDKK